jgi:hypothetical protein
VIMRRLIDSWVNRPSLDVPLVVTAGILVALLDPHNVPPANELGNWYQTLASVSGALLALGGVALTVVFAVTPTNRLQLVYRATGPRLAKLVLSCLGSLALATAGFVALFIVAPTASELRNALTGALVALAALRFARLWWLFRRVLTALMARDTRVDPAVVGDPIWERPIVDENDYALPGRKPRRQAR